MTHADAIVIIAALSASVGLLVQWLDWRKE